MGRLAVLDLLGGPTYSGLLVVPYFGVENSERFTQFALYRRQL